MTISTTLAEAVVAAVVQARDIIGELIRQESPFEDGLLPPSAGGTGVDNGTNTLTLGANITLNESPPGIPVEITEGGTGATTAANARTNLGTNDAANVTTGTLAAARLGASPTAPKLLFGDNTWAILVEADIPGLNTSKITAGTMAPSRLGSGTPTASTLLWGDSTWAALVAGDLPSHNHAAGDITSGTMAPARLGGGTPSGSTILFGNSAWDVLSSADIPNLDTAKITTGIFADARIPSLAASKITSGTFAVARLGSGTPTASTALWGDGAWSALAASDIPNLDTSKITTGTMAAARLGSGASSTTALFGDQTYKTVPTGTGSNGRVAFWTGTSSLSNDANFSFNTGDNTLTASGGFRSVSNNRWELGSYTAAGSNPIIGYLIVAVDGVIRRLAVV